MENITVENNKMNPVKFTLWVAIGSICMMFAALTSAYIVKKNQGNFLEFDFPTIFMVSTIAIVVSSGTMHLALKAFREKQSAKYRNMILITLVLGVAFLVMQILGFKDLQANHIALTGQLSNPSASFFLVIVGLHLLHILGGVIALLIRMFKKVEKDTLNSVEMVATYWHFVDFLWIYLFIFLHLVK